ncbi:MAG: extensin family protein, partial [Rhizobiales bacterium]|nr:extensin family protein [Hyphomicrobiales bacterium]
MRLRSKFSGFVLILLLLAAAMLAAVLTRLIPDPYNPLVQLDLSAKPNLVTGIKLRMLSGNTRACIAVLSKAGVNVQAMPERTDEPGCYRRGTITLSRLSRAGFEPEEMRCDLALRLYLLERHGIQPLARRHFGSEVERIHHFGSYSCRTIRGSWRQSQHATANAFDMAGFQLANGRGISLKNDWSTGGPAALFLRDIRTHACQWFNIVLSPDYNADHADHFHFD